MATNQDIMAFLMAEKAARQIEKEEEKVARAKERQEDMEKIKAMIESGVKKEVKAEIEAVTEPLKERLQKQEMATSDLNKQFSEVLKEVRALRETSNFQQFPSLPESGTLNTFFRGNSVAQLQDTRNNPEHARKVQDLCADARKVVGFTPIEPRMLELQMNSYGAENLDQAMHMEVKSYLKCEMKMYPSDIQKLDIVRVFPAHSGDTCDILYVEFGSEYQVDKVFQHTRYMAKRDHRVLHWFPSQMRERKAAIEKLAYDIREAGRATKVRTRVKVGRDDLELCTKLPGGKWKRELLPPDLPPIDFLYSPGPAQTSSPPPGRPGRDSDSFWSRKRLKSPDSETDEASKKLKGVEHNKSDASRGDSILQKPCSLPNPNLESVDKGIFTGLEAYSPSTPAKAKSIPDLSIIVNSPVFHSKSNKN